MPKFDLSGTGYQYAQIVGCDWGSTTIKGTRMARIGRSALAIMLALLSAPSIADVHAQSLESEINAAMGVASTPAPAPESAATAPEPAPQPGPPPVGDTPQASLANPLSPWTGPDLTSLTPSTSAGVYCVPTTQICVDNVDELVEVIIAYLNPRPCDPGDIGVQPVCFALDSEACPAGYVGLPPLCVDPNDLFPAGCPPDTTGVSPACVTTDGLLPAIGSVADDDCPEGKATTLSAFCAARESASVAYTPPGTTFDSMFPTLNYNDICPNGEAGDGYCQTDNRALTVWMEGTLDSSGKDSIRWTLNNSWDTTKLNVSYPSSPSYSGGSETDIIYRWKPADVPSGKDGIAFCNGRVSDNRCDQHYVSFLSTSAGRRIACHETGHAVGLTHGQEASPKQSNGLDALACMTTGPIESEFVGQHNEATVNYTYGG